MFCAVQGNAELAESKEEQKRRNRGWRWRNKEGKEAGLQRSGGMGCKCKWLTTDICFSQCKHIYSPAEFFVLPGRTLGDIFFNRHRMPSPSSVLLEALPALWSFCSLGPAGSFQSCVLSSLSSIQPHCRNSVTDIIPNILKISWIYILCVWMSCFHMCRMCVHECVNIRDATYVCQASNEDEGPRRVWPGQLEPDLTYLAEACCHFHCWGAVFSLMHGLKLFTNHKKKKPCSTHIIYLIFNDSSSPYVFFIYTCITAALFTNLVCFHSFTNSVTWPVMNDLQPLMNWGLEPVMKACQGQHFSIPVRAEHKCFYLIKMKKKLKSHLLVTFQTNNCQLQPFMLIYELPLQMNW